MNKLVELKEIAKKSYEESLNRGESLTFIAVSKGRTIEEIEELINQGQIDFGENRLQEIEEKWEYLLRKYPFVKLHFIGHIQTNKLRKIVKLCSGGIHSLDRESLLNELIKLKKEGVEIPNLFIEINVGLEEQKHGIESEKLDGFYKQCVDNSLPVIGLMCIPPVNMPPSPYFAYLLTLKNKTNLKYLSMGMSKDFKEAIMLGATHIRIGSAIWTKK